MSNEELVLLYQQGNNQALESLIDNNGGIIRNVANKFYGINKMIEFDDLIQSGVIGLIAATKKYDINRKNKVNFITYAFHYIKREIENNKLNNNCVRLDTPLKEDTEEIACNSYLEYNEYYLVFRNGVQRYISKSKVKEINKSKYYYRQDFNLNV